MTSGCAGGFLMGCRGIAEGCKCGRGLCVGDMLEGSGIGSW